MDLHSGRCAVCRIEKDVNINNICTDCSRAIRDISLEESLFQLAEGWLRKEYPSLTDTDPRWVAVMNFAGYIGGIFGKKDDIKAD